MVDREELCNKIREMYPQMGDCDTDLNVSWDEEQNAWAVDFTHGPDRQRHYLEDADAAACLDGRQCVGLGIEFGQFYRLEPRG